MIRLGFDNIPASTDRINIVSPKVKMVKTLESKNIRCVDLSVSKRSEEELKLFEMTSLKVQA